MISEFWVCYVSNFGFMISMIFGLWLLGFWVYDFRVLGSLCFEFWVYCFHAFWLMITRVLALVNAVPWAGRNTEPEIMKLGDEKSWNYGTKHKSWKYGTKIRVSGLWFLLFLVYGFRVWRLLTKDLGLWFPSFGFVMFRVLGLWFTCF